MTRDMLPEVARAVRPDPLHLWAMFCILAATRANAAAWTWDHHGVTPTRVDVQRREYQRFVVPETYA